MIRSIILLIHLEMVVVQLILMYAMTKMRLKQGKGDPGGFKQYLRQENIKPGINVRYLGN